MEKITLYLESLACPDCAQKIGQILEKQKGVVSAKVHYTTSKVIVEYEAEEISIEQIEKTIGKTGYRIIKRQ